MKSAQMKRLIPPEGNSLFISFIPLVGSILLLPNYHPHLVDTLDVPQPVE